MRKVITIILSIMMVSVWLVGCTTTKINPIDTAPPTDPPTASVTPTDTAETTTILTDEDMIRQYFQDNSWPIQLSEDNAFIDYPIDDDVLDGKRIFFTGEIHGVSANYSLRMAYLKHFKEKTNFRYYLCEMPYSHAYFLNQYMNTGDESLLDLVLQSHRSGSTVVRSQEEYNHWIELYQYNQTLDDKNKIRVIGVDIDGNAYIAYRCLIDMLPDDDIPQEIADDIALLHDTLAFIETNLTSHTKYLETSQHILDRIQHNRSIYEDYLGEHLVFFELVHQNLLQFNVANKEKADKIIYNNTRDQMIYDNFLTIDNVLDPHPYYGQWGFAHAFQKANNDVMWFAAHLNNADSKYHKQVFTVFYNYIDCEGNDPLGRSTVELNALLPVIYDNQTYPHDSLVLYDMNHAVHDRPPLHMIEMYTGEPTGQDIADFFQYIVLIRGSGATTPLYQ